MPLCSVRSDENIAKFRRHIKTYRYNFAYPPELPGVSMNLLTTEMFIDSETEQSLCMDTPAVLEIASYIT